MDTTTTAGLNDAAIRAYMNTNLTGQSETSNSDTCETSSCAITSSGDYLIWLICRYCGGNHNEEHCPRVKEIRYRKNGKIKWVEFHEPQPEYHYHYPPGYWNPGYWQPSPQPTYDPYPTITWYGSGTATNA